MITKNMRLFLGFALFLIPLHEAFATYDVYLMNNTPVSTNLKNSCNNLGSGECTGFNDGNLVAYKRKRIFSVNYDSGIKRTKDYTVKSYFTTPGGASGNYFAIDIHGDTIGSHLTGVFAVIAGKKYQLLRSNNSAQKVLPNQVGHGNFTDVNGKEYVVYATTQKDHPFTDQGIDSIYLSMSEIPTVFKSSAANEISMITYNIQAFPEYMGAFLDLNKPLKRMLWLGQQKFMRNADVIVFEEAWDNGMRASLKQSFHDTFPYFIDPVPENTHTRPLNSGLLVLSKYPIVSQYFVNYQDHQSLVDSDNFSNKGALYFKINKDGRYYNFIATHTQAQDDTAALAVRQQEFTLIKKLIINNPKLPITKGEPLNLIGDLNTDYYNQSQFSVLNDILGLNTANMENSINEAPKYSNDSALNLMISPSDNEKGMYDYIVPIYGYTQPVDIQRQITPLRALDYGSMYQRSNNFTLYNYGDVESSDHFMVQALFKY